MTELDPIDDSDSDYSLDYEYIGPRQAHYRDASDANSDCSEISEHPPPPGFDMWDEDPYSTNDFTWESNDMRLSCAIYKHYTVPRTSLWRKDRGWPRQLLNSQSTTNHDQSASAVCLAVSHYGMVEQLYAVYRDRILKCGQQKSKSSHRPRTKRCLDATWIEASLTPTPTDTDTPPSTTDTTASAPTAKFTETHLALSQPAFKATQPTSPPTDVTDPIARFVDYTKYIQRQDFPPVSVEDAYISPGFEPLCIAHKYGYMAIGGIEGEFELYCCMGEPTKIWGTKFKGKKNVLLMTNNIQIVRRKTLDSHEHYLIVCMNEAGVLVYRLPPHCECMTFKVQLHAHLRHFRMAVNHAQISPDGQWMYVAWNPSSTHFAHTSDSHSQVTVWDCLHQCIVKTIDARGYTYAIQFHPFLDNLLVFSNRYGYFHTVQWDASFHDTTHEITLVSFRGEKDTRLRILAKINGIQWSHKGDYLYVATKKRVLAYELKTKQVPSLVTLSCQETKKLLVNPKKRKRQYMLSLSHPQWQTVPPTIKAMVLAEATLSTHS
ncbi:hypothetical protein BDF14DRAFT_1740884 [Spinellus fusiger]|nr:hypothetical protein BDF14DRAFT_1740884 [Spinellus fusiger]